MKYHMESVKKQKQSSLFTTSFMKNTQNDLDGGIQKYINGNTDLHAKERM